MLDETTSVCQSGIVFAVVEYILTCMTPPAVTAANNSARPLNLGCGEEMHLMTIVTHRRLSRTAALSIHSNSATEKLVSYQ